jgi:hypothetical protein
VKRSDRPTRFASDFERLTVQLVLEVHQCSYPEY